MEDKMLPMDLKEKYGGKVPYDMYFPTQQLLVEKRFCSVCGMYFSSVKSLTQQHRKICKKPRKRKTVANKLAPVAKKTVVTRLAPSAKKTAVTKLAPAKRTVVTKLAPPAKQTPSRPRKNAPAPNELIDGTSDDLESENEDLLVE